MSALIIGKTESLVKASKAKKMIVTVAERSKICQSSLCVGGREFQTVLLACMPALSCGATCSFLFLKV